MNPYRTVTPVRPVAGYIGGKRHLAAHLVPIIDGTEHALYAEPFVGMGGVFLRRTSAPAAEVINDISRDVATLFRILQRHYVPFLDMLRFQLTTRAEFERLAATPPETLTDLERAARFLYLQRLAFGGKVTGRNFGMTMTGPARFNITQLGPVLEEVHARLAGVVIECLPWRSFIETYDRPGALFYLDPPYWGSEGDYGPVFERGDFRQLVEVLGRLQGQFILSINDVPAVREIFAAFRLEPVQTTYTIAGGDAAAPARELVITPAAGLRPRAGRLQAGVGF